MSDAARSVRASIDRTARRTLALLAGSPARGRLRKKAMTGHLPRSLWARLPVDGVFTVPTAYGEFLYDGSADDMNARDLFWRALQGIESETLDVFQKAVVDADVVVDVGANRGLYTLTALAANPAVRVVAFEASPRTFAHLEAMIALNGWAERVTAINAAAAESAGTLSFHVPDMLYASSARLVASRHRTGVDGEVIAVPAVPLDETVRSADVVKIDVEGAENLVLAGMSRLLAESRPTVFMEVLPEGPTGDCESLLTTAGYEFFHLRADGAKRMDHLVPDPERRFRNYLCRFGGDDS